MIQPFRAMRSITEFLLAYRNFQLANGHDTESRCGHCTHQLYAEPLSRRQGLQNLFGSLAQEHFELRPAVTDDRPAVAQ
jgi:hypothetical protein